MAYKQLLDSCSANAGMHPDGNGLYLQVQQGTHGLTRSWVYRYSTAGKQTWLGLGPYPHVTLAQAREKAIDARRLRLEGNDPLAHRRNQRVAVRRQQANQAVPSFDECRNQYVAWVAQYPTQSRLGLVVTDLRDTCVRQHASGHDRHCPGLQGVGANLAFKN
jgi:Arm DNA-binding domain